MQRTLAGPLFLMLCVMSMLTPVRAAEPPAPAAFPFQIDALTRKIGAGGFPNTSANPFARMNVTVFKVRHRGAPVKLRDGNALIDEFLEARILEGASQPALLLAGAGIYLLSEPQGQLKVEVMAPGNTDIARWQWLDAKSGQPDAEHNVTIRDRSGERRSENGGRLLLLNHERVLDLATLRHYPVAITSYESIEKMGGYNAGNQPAAVLSPGRSQYAVVGSRSVGSGFEYAMVAVDYAKGAMYAVPFDRNTLHFESVWDATPEWIGHGFEWSRQADGTERLQLRRNAKPMPWQGRFARFGGGMVDYRLYPTEPAMYEALLAFLRETYGAADARSPNGSSNDAQSRTLAIEGSTLRVWYQAAEKTTSLYADVPASVPPQSAYALVEKIGTRFNQTLREGRHQQLFTEYPVNR